MSWLINNSRGLTDDFGRRSRLRISRARRIPVETKPRLFAWPLSLIRPAENPASLHFRFRRWRRRRRNFSLRRRWRHRQVFALHRIDELAIRRPPDRRTGIGARGHVL